MAGLRKASLQNKKCSFITLTSSPHSTEGLNDSEKCYMLHNALNLLRKRLSRYYGIEIKSYFRVFTNEGYGVIHIIVVCKYIPRYILVNEWNEIHGSQIVDIRLIGIDVGVKKISHYMTSQYLKEQKKSTFTRYGMSSQWVFRGFVRVWNDIKKQCRTYMGKWRFNEFYECWYNDDIRLDLSKALKWFNEVLYERLGIDYPYQSVFKTFKPTEQKNLNGLPCG